MPFGHTATELIVERDDAEKDSSIAVGMCLEYSSCNSWIVR